MKHLAILAACIAAFSFGAQAQIFGGSVTSGRVFNASCSAGQIPVYDSNKRLTACGSASGSGTVTNVAMTGIAGIINVGGSPVTTTGTFALSLASQVARRVFIGPDGGADAAPTFRALVAADIPASLTSNTSGNAGTATALAANGTNCASGEAARGVDASGNAEGCFTPSGGGSPTIEANGTSVGTRSTINFLPGANTTVLGNDTGTEVEITYDLDLSQTNLLYARLGAMNAYASSSGGDYRAGLLYLPFRAAFAPTTNGEDGIDSSTGLRYFRVGGVNKQVATTSGTKTTGKQVAFDANGDLIASASDIGGGASFDPFNLTSPWLIDDFCGASSGDHNGATAGIGTLLWRVGATGGGTALRMNQAGDKSLAWGHCGVKIGTGSTSGNNTYLARGSEQGPSVLPTGVVTDEWVISIPTITSVQVSRGWSDEAYVVTPCFDNSRACAAFTFIAGTDTNWQLRWCNNIGGTLNTVDTGIPVVAGRAYRLRLAKSASALIATVVEQSAGASFTSSSQGWAPTIIGTSLQPTTYVETLTSAARTLNVYRYVAQFTPATRY